MRNSRGITIRHHVFIALFIFLFLPVKGIGQMDSVRDTLKNKRLKKIVISSSIFYGGSLVYYYYSWYKDSPTGGFVWRNDNATWLQLDKFGHSTTVFTTSEYMYQALRWSGISNTKASIYGGLAGLINMTTVEIFDGFHSRWGASWGDMLANASGAILFSSQQLIWKEQRIRLKFSYWPSDKYARFNPEILGNTHLKRIIKDYNSQTYWLSTNIYSWSKKSNIPKYLNIAFGYGGRGLAINPLYDSHGNILPDYIKTRQYYLSMDIDWQKIPTKSKFLKTLFKAISFVKIPFPTLEYNSTDNFVWHWIHF